MFRNGFNRWFLLWFPGSYCSESSSGQIHSCLWSNKSRWSKILLQPKMATKTQRNKLSNKRFWRQFRWFLSEILKREGLGFKPCNRSVFINRINSKFFKRGKKEYAFSDFVLEDLIDGAFSTFISFYYRDVAFFSLISFNYRDGAVFYLYIILLH